MKQIRSSRLVVLSAAFLLFTTSVIAGTIKLSVLISDKDDPAEASPRTVFGWAFSPQGANVRDTSGWRILTLGAKEE